MGKNPQQSAVHRSKKGATVQNSAEAKAGQDRSVGPGGSRRAHGSDKGAKGGGRGGAVPPEQQSDKP
ncbi:MULTISPECIES: hypothetical protein [Streptomyces]|uniref:23S rRNA (Guanosine(2251)-2'-O)-methyltransferase RlmB n=1 Tax=Streptomyces luteosporeus TaxID=173856 RepID=A0ABP6GE69_9ACTN